jgi:hypothetical protein
MTPKHPSAKLPADTKPTLQKGDDAGKKSGKCDLSA